MGRAGRARVAKGATDNGFVIFIGPLEVICPKTVRGDEPVGSGVPMRRETQVRRVIEHRNPDCLAARVRPEVIHPLGALAPGFGIPITPAVEDRAALSAFDRHWPRHPHHQAAVPLVAKGDGGIARVKLHIVIHQHLLVFQRDKCEPHFLAEHQGAIAEPLIVENNLPGFAGRDPIDPLQPDLRRVTGLGRFRFLLPRPPEVVAVDIAVRKTNRAVMGVILGFARDSLLHGKVPGDILAVRSDHRIQVGPDPVLVPPFGENPAVDLHLDPVLECGNRHLGGEPGGAQGQRENSQKRGRFHIQELA